jgi:hypothetical protein
MATNPYVHQTHTAGTCAHVRKTYAPHILTSDPPQHPWVCPDCLDEGVEIKFSSHVNPPETYEDILQRKRGGGR